MAYRIAEAGAQGVRLVQTSVGWALAALGALVGGIVLIAAIALYFAGLRGTGMLSAVGLAFAIIPWRIVATRSRIDPQEIIFDNINGLVALVQRSRDSAVAGFIPYQDIRGFGTRSESMNTNGSTSSATSTLHRRHYLYFERRDDSTWDLVSSGSSAAVQDMKMRMQQYVDLSRTCDSLPDAPLPPGLKIQNQDGVCELTWRNSITSLFLLPYLFLAAYFSVLRQYTVMAEGHGEEGFDWILKLMVGVGLMVGVIFTVSMFREADRGRRLRIDARNLELAILSRKGAPLRATTIPLEEIVDVRLEFSETIGASPIQVLTTEDEAVAKHIQGWKLSLADLKTAVRNSMTHQIDLGLLTTAEKLNVVNFIQRTVDYRRGRKSAPPEPAANLSSYWWRGRPSRSLSSGLISNTTLGVLMIVTAPVQLFILGMLMIPGELHAMRDYFHALTVIESTLRSVFPLLGAVRLGQAGRKFTPLLLVVTTVLMLMGPHVPAVAEISSYANLLLIPLAIKGGIDVLRLGDI